MCGRRRQSSCERRQSYEGGVCNSGDTVTHTELRVLTWLKSVRVLTWLKSVRLVHNPALGENHALQTRERGLRKREACVRERREPRTPNTLSLSPSLALAPSPSLVLALALPFFRALAFSPLCACILAVSHTVHEDIRTSRVMKGADL